MYSKKIFVSFVLLLIISVKTTNGYQCYECTNPLSEHCINDNVTKMDKVQCITPKMCIKTIVSGIKYG